MNRTEVVTYLDLPGTDPENLTIMPKPIATWWKSHWAGASSQAIVHHILGIDFPDYNGINHPLDEGDYARCRHVLKKFPQLQERFDEMATVSPGWAAFVAAWPRLQAADIEGNFIGGSSSPTSKLIQEILASLA